MDLLVELPLAQHLLHGAFLHTLDLVDVFQCVDRVVILLPYDADLLVMTVMKRSLVQQWTSVMSIVDSES